MFSEFTDTVSAWLENFQSRLCAGLEVLDGGVARFGTDTWQRAEGGGGISRTIAGGALIEKGGVMYSRVHGPVTERMARVLKLEGEAFLATGVSVVLHPHSPHVPIIHMNVRYFELGGPDRQGAPAAWWFGGGIDLTPHYVDERMARAFHQRLRDVCERAQPGYYPRFKAWADDYFYIPHREETRGVGGVFYDRLGVDEPIGKDGLWAFTRNLAEAFLPAYAEQAARFREYPITEEQRAWQRLRRGRYVEFNLVHDAGTKFGLETGGRTESILMSLPPLAAWEYAHIPTPGNAEERTQSLLKKGIDWVESTVGG